MNTVEKIILKENKTLKLSNVLIRKIKESEINDYEKISYLMQSYVKSKGSSIIGPMIQYSDIVIAEQNPKVVFKLLVQLKDPLNNIDSPYEFESLIRVPNCIFARFKEKEVNLHFAYSKINLYAFENDIMLKGDSYTILLNKNEDNLIADIFMEVKKED